MTDPMTLLPVVGCSSKKIGKMIRPAARTNSSSNAGPKSTKGPVHPLSSSRRGVSRQLRMSFGLIVGVMVTALLAMGAVALYSMFYFSRKVNKPLSPNNRIAPKQQVSTSKVHLIVEGVREEFNKRYGGKEAAQAMLKRGITSFGNIDATARRMVSAAIEQRPFVMAFSGYSVTVGRGNFFNQSFPFVVERILQQPLQSILGISLVVRNAAIGGIPSFPYGFCMEHFLGSDPDVISWDYSMNEGREDASILEAFLRQASQQLKNHPMMIMLDTNFARTQLLQDYTNQGLLLDAITVGKAEVVDKALFGQKPAPPLGLQHWEEFGAPDQCPGRGSWHPKKMEHELIGWMIAMHFVEALERAHRFLGSSERQQLEIDSPVFPAPLTKVPVNDPEVTELLYGHKEDEKSYRIKDLSCRTSFLPATDHTKVLPSIIVSGFAEGDLDIMVDRTDSHYKEGWVLDVSKVERDTKRKVERCGGLGYIDMKIALYGVPDSGTLRLWLPFEGPSHDNHRHEHDDSEDNEAKHWFDDFIICEANEKRDEGACKLDQDLEITVGGVGVSRITQINGAGEYLRRRTCVNVGVPSDAKTTVLKNVVSTDGQPLSSNDKRRFGVDDNTVGLLVDIRAKPRVTRSKGACCVSHIIWEQH